MTAIGAVILIAALILTFADVNKRVQRIGEQRNQLAAGNSALESLSELKASAEKAETYFTLLEKILPAEEVISKDFPNALQNIANKNNVKMQFSLGDKVPAQNNGPATSNFTIKTTSSYANLTNFLKSVEASAFVVRWQVLDISRSGTQYSATVFGSVFHK